MDDNTRHPQTPSPLSTDSFITNALDSPLLPAEIRSFRLEDYQQNINEIHIFYTGTRKLDQIASRARQTLTVYAESHCQNVSSLLEMLPALTRLSKRAFIYWISTFNLSESEDIARYSCSNECMQYIFQLIAGLYEDVSDDFAVAFGVQMEDPLYKNMQAMLDILERWRNGCRVIDGI